jgi:peptidoglycan/LPS O-acetylase OafA/YrhL
MTAANPRPPRLAYRPELDGLRAVAILLVFLQHAQVSGFAFAGWAGVTVFFTLSGFLITSLLVVEMEGSGRIDLGLFYFRRALRLLPALAAMVAVVLLVGAITGRNLGLPALATLFYVGNWADIAGLPMGILGHTWSLGIEEQFYLAWPILLIFVRSQNGRLLVCAAGIVSSIFIRYLVFDPGPELIGRAYQGLDVRADALLLGCALALLRWSFPRWAGVLGLAVMVLAIALVPSKTGWVHLGIPLTAIGTALMIGSRIPITAGALVALGGISYGFYLWHFPIIESTRWLAASLSPPALVAVWFIATLLVSVASRRLVELPALALRERLWLRAARLRRKHNALDRTGQGDQQAIAKRRDACGAAREDRDGLDQPA